MRNDIVDGCFLRRYCSRLPWLGAQDRLGVRRYAVGTCLTDVDSASSSMMKWLLGSVALACSLVLAAPAFADAPSMPSGQPGEQIRLLTPPAMPAPIMIVARAAPAALETPADSSSVPLRADRVSYVLPPGAAISVQSPAVSVQEATFSANRTFGGLAAVGGFVRALEQARASFDPTNGYNVSVSLCTSNAENQPIPGQVLSLTFRGASGRVLFGATVTTDESGCYHGTLALGRGVTEVPVTISDVDPQSGATDFPIAPPP
jgi:hypothetical protein